MKYLLALISEEGGMEDRSPEEMREAMGKWQEFTDETVKAGAFISGEGLQPSSTAPRKASIVFSGQRPAPPR